MMETEQGKALTRLNNLIRRTCQGFKPPEDITVSQWADKYRTLQSENSAEVGRWRTTRTPYLREIMDAFTDPAVKEIAVVASSQVGKTEMLLNILAYVIDQDPATIMFGHPTIEEAEKFSKQRISPMIRDIEKLRTKVQESKSRFSGNTIRQKIFPGGVLNLVGSNSPASLASVPARYVFGDEVDRWAKSAGSEGDPWDLLKARTSTFYNAKRVRVSTPTVAGGSAIEKAFNDGTQEYWCVQCPHCGEYSFITFDNIKFECHVIEDGRSKQYVVDEVNWACPECGCYTDEYTTKRQPMRWIAKSPEAIKNGTRSFWINGFYSPWMKWETIVTRFLNSKDDPQKLQTVYNTLFGQLWENRGDLEDEDELASRAEDYGAEVPDGVLCLTCGVDTQGDRLEYEVVGYGFYGENWGIEKGILSGDPATDEPWEKLDGVIGREWSYKDGKTLKISMTFVDSGGNKTQDVYEQCARRLNKRVLAVKGQGGEGIPFTKPATRIKYNCHGRIGKSWLVMIGVDEGKERIMTGLKVREEGARRSHFPIHDGKNGYDALFYRGLLSERVERTASGKFQWVKLPGHERNEALDCRNYANAAFRVLSPNLDLIKQRLENPLAGPEIPKASAGQPKKNRRVHRNRALDGEW